MPHNGHDEIALARNTDHKFYPAIVKKVVLAKHARRANITFTWLDDEETWNHSPKKVTVKRAGIPRRLEDDEINFINAKPGRDKIGHTNWRLNVIPAIKRLEDTEQVDAGGHARTDGITTANNAQPSRPRATVQAVQSVSPQRIAAPVTNLNASNAESRSDRSDSQQDGRSHQPSLRK